jgi:hypothetical protein
MNSRALDNTKRPTLTTLTNTPTTTPFLQHQQQLLLTPTNLNGHPIAHRLCLYILSDDHYKFNLAHSLATRLQVINALAIVKGRYKENYKLTLDYVNNHPQVNIDHLKRLATAPRRAHNESKAPHTHPT